MSDCVVTTNSAKQAVITGLKGRGFLQVGEPGCHHLPCEIVCHKSRTKTTNSREGNGHRNPRADGVVSIKRSEGARLRLAKLYQRRYFHADQSIPPTRIPLTTTPKQVDKSKHVFPLTKLCASTDKEVTSLVTGTRLVTGTEDVTGDSQLKCHEIVTRTHFKDLEPMFLSFLALPTPIPGFGLS